MSAEKIRKVIIGCKGDPALKWEIMQEAEESGMSLSEYVETILENRQMQDDVKILRFRLKEEQRSKQEVLSKLEDYENRLAPFYKELKDQTMPFMQKDGSTTAKMISNPIDMLDCFLSSVNLES